MIKKLLLCLLALNMLFVYNIYSCSTFSATIGNSKLAGNSEDWNDINSMIKFFPASDGKYGKFIFGFKDWELDFCPWGGVNDQGLFYDWLSTGLRNPDFHAQGTINYSGVLADKMLEECATVEEAITLFQKYNCPGIGGAHIFIADRFGNSVVMEEGENNSVAVIRKTGNYQAATNFLNAYLSDPEIYRWVQCPRYEFIDGTLSNSDTISVELFQNMLKHVGNNGDLSPTIYSNIYDFNSGKMYIYNYYHFEEVLILDINEELAKGYRFFELPGLFSGLKSEYPIDGAVIHSSSVQLKWVGNASEYEIHLSTDLEFTSPTVILQSAQEPQEAGFSSMVVIGIMFILLVVGLIKSKKLLLTGAFILLLFPGCEGLFTDLPETKSAINHAVIAENLEPGTVYFWKVIAINSEGFQTETSVESFSTAEFSGK
jgi:hypothetical protein